MNEWNIEWMDDDDWINGWMDKEMNGWNIEWMDDQEWMNVSTCFINLVLPPLDSFFLTKKKKIAVDTNN